MPKLSRLDMVMDIVDDVLRYPRGTQGFATAAPAVFSIERDELGNTRTVSSNAYVGFPLAEKIAGLTRTEILGYVECARSSSHVEGEYGQQQKVSQLHAGLKFERHWAGAYRLSLRPAYFHDRADKTRIIAGNLEFTPFWTLSGNSLRATNILSRFSSVEVRPVVRGKLNFGHF